MRDDGPIRCDWGTRSMDAEHILRITTTSMATCNQTPTDANPAGTEVSIVLEGEIVRGNVTRAVLHFVPRQDVHPPTFDGPDCLRCWFDVAGLAMAMAQLRQPDAALLCGRFGDGTLLAVLRTSPSRISLR